MKKIHVNLDAMALNEYETVHTRVGELKNVLYHLLGYDKFVGLVSGKPSQIDALAAGAAAEKTFLTNINNYGSGDPRTIQSKYELDHAIRKFENETNISWPIR